jgi:hypothetical protein
MRRLLAALKLDQKAQTDPGRRSELALAESLCESGSADGCAKLLSSHVMFPIGNITADSFGLERQMLPIGNSDATSVASHRNITDREHSLTA